MATCLTDIPVEVISTCLLPFLSVNEVLGTRRVCRWIKNLSEDHLRRHPRSRNIIQIYIADKEDGQSKENDLKFPTVKCFLREEQELAKRAEEVEADFPIPLPTSRFTIKVESPKSFRCLHLRDFLLRYGNQMKYLKIERGKLPYTHEELSFYNQIPNLRHLIVVQGCGYSVIDPVEVTQVPLPQTLRKLIRLSVDGDCPGFSTWRLLEFCCNLQRLRIVRHVVNAQDMHRLITIFDQGRHKNIKFLDLGLFNNKVLRLHRVGCRQVVSELYTLVTKYNLKLLNVPILLFHEIMKTHRDEFLPRIASLGKFDISNYRLSKIWRGSMPQVKEVVLCNECTPSDINLNLMSWIIQRNLRLFSTNKMPNLRKLTLMVYPDQVQLLAGIWSNFPRIQELYLSQALILPDVLFLGELGELPFLQLANLKLLDLGIIDKEDHACSNRGIVPLTEASFIQVFSQMRLREFRFRSLKPLKHVTTQGIRALLAGPFHETIELFPFDGWSLEGMSRRELQLLSQEFRCNKF